MLILDASTKLQLVLGGAITTNALEWTAHYLDTVGHSPALATGTSNNTTDVDMVAATAGRVIKAVAVYNADTVAATVTIKTDNSGTERRLCKVTLATLETLYYEDGSGWFVVDSAGGLKSAGSTGRLISTSIVNAGTTTVTAPVNATSGFARLVGGGGGGGGTTSSASNAAVGGGGGAGGYLEKTFAATGGTAYTCAVGTGGSGGNTSGGTGGTGNDTTLTVGGVTYTAKGGNGGVGQTFGTGLAVVLGGAVTAVSTNGDVNSAGQPGANAIRLSGTVAVSGAGGGSVFGGAGSAKSSNSAGVDAIGFGSGGGGGCALSSAVAGGAGKAGILIIDWYT